jgi:hypothetical protein
MYQWRNLRAIKVIKKIAVFFALVCLLLGSIIFIMPNSSDKIASFFYRELLYNRLADLHGAGDSEEEVVINLFEYVAKNLTTMPDHNLVDRNAFTDIIRGIAWCDQQAFVLMNLLSKAGINESRLRDVQAHTYSEVFIGEKWVIVDPYAGFLPVSKNNVLLGIDDLESVDIAGSFLEKIRPPTGSQGAVTNFKETFKSIYIENEARWPKGIGLNFKRYRAYNFDRNVIMYLADSFYYLFGSSYFNWVQDVYLSSEKVENMDDQGGNWVKNYNENFKEDNAAFQLYYKARNLEVADRKELADLHYRNIVLLFPDSYWALVANTRML